MNPVKFPISPTPKGRETPQSVLEKTFLLDVSNKSDPERPGDKIIKIAGIKVDQEVSNKSDPERPGDDASFAGLLRDN
jgi:hypothetical protein